MDTELSSSFNNTLLLTIIPFIFLVIKLLIKKISSPKLPPGPWKLPVIGNMHQVPLVLPPRLLRDLAKRYGPLMHLQLGEVSLVVASSPETAKQVLKTNDICLASRPQSSVPLKMLSYGFTDLVNSAYGDYWRELRKICTLEFLTTKRVQSFQPIREEEFSDLVGWLSSNSGSVVNLTRKLTSTLHKIISRATFGRRIEDHETLTAVLTEALIVASGCNISDAYPSIKLLHYLSGVQPRMERLHGQLDKILEKNIKQHPEMKSKEERKYEGLLDVLLTYQGKDAQFSLTNDNIKGILLDMFAGGGWTSSLTIGRAMHEMLKNPSILKKAQDEVRRIFNPKGFVDEANLPELKYLKTVIKETFRLYPPEPLLLHRECIKPCEIDGYSIPLKTRVLVNTWAIGRDPEYWEDSECFKPERFADSSIDYKGNHFEYLPFGAGRRICPGLSFGVVIVEFALAKFLYHFDWKLPSGTVKEELSDEDDFLVIPIRV